MLALPNAIDRTGRLFNRQRSISGSVHRGANHLPTGSRAASQISLLVDLLPVRDTHFAQGGR